jgi:hypothetical protein
VREHFLQYPPVSIHGVPVSFDGVCAAGGIHDDIDSASYDLSGSSEQSDWFPCAKCLCLFFARSPGPELSLCAAGGAHEKFDNGNPAFDYTLSGSRDQPGWLWCNKCKCLFFGEPLNNPDACAAPTHNDTGSLDYYLETSRPAQSDWLVQQVQGPLLRRQPWQQSWFFARREAPTPSVTAALQFGLVFE